MTILLVDDEPIVRDVLRRCIETAGYHVLEAASGAEATQLARSFPGPIHLAIIDQNLEYGRKGADVAAEIATTQPGIRVLLISGMLEQDTLAVPFDADLTFSFLEKPFTHQVLIERIRQMLGSVNTAGM